MESSGEARREPSQVQTVNPLGEAVLGVRGGLNVESLSRGETVGRYVILHRLGAGGMGVVYAAYDPELDRKVAIKLLRARGSGHALPGRGQQRLLREARAMARLTHPNVVAVHDIGVHAGHVFLAMDFVDGQTLRTWMDGGLHGWRDVVSVFAAAGRGLAAAHAANLVHRDFKPDNVMLTRDGRVLVMDFGLVRAEEDRDSPDESDDADEASPAGGVSVMPQPASTAKPSPSSLISKLVTQTGARLGTPAYMSPEQHLCLAIDPRSDQFSFCVTFYEALYGHRPFSADSMAALAVQIVEGRIKDPPRDAEVPGWIRRVVVQGLAAEAGSRHPDMSALLDALERDPATRRRRWMAGAAGIAVLGLLGVALRAGSETRAEACKGGEERVAAIWNDDTRDAVRTALRATGLPYAETTLAHVEGRLDDFATAWATEHELACLATHVNKTQSEALLDMRMLCLERRLRGMEASVDILSETTSETLANAASAVEGLENLAACADTATLTAITPPPGDEAARIALAEIGEELDRIRVLDSVGRMAEALARVRTLEKEAVALGWEPLLAEVRLELGSLEEDAGEYEAARRTLLDALTLARAHGVDRVAVQAAHGLAWLYGVTLRQPERGLDWIALARADSARTKEDPLVRAMMLNTEASLLDVAGEHEEAIATFEEALLAAEELGDEGVVRRAVFENNLAAALFNAGRLDEAARHYREALDIFENVHGDTHPSCAVTVGNLAIIEGRVGNFARARALHERGLQTQIATYGNGHVAVARALRGLGALLIRGGEPEDAIETLERARSILEERFGTDHRDVGLVGADLGLAYEQVGRLEDARALLARADAILQEDPVRANVLDNLGQLALHEERPHEALELHREAARLREETRGHEDPALADSLTGQGQALVELGRSGEALPLLERSLKLQGEAAGDPGLAAITRFTLARALFVATGDTPRALELARAALQRPSTPRLDAQEVNAWIASLPREEGR